MTSALDRAAFTQPRAAAAQPGPAAACPVIGDAEIIVAAQGMSLAGTGAGGSMRLLSALLDERLDLPALSERINAQPGIALRVMRVANSAYYGHSGAVSSVDRAARVVGLTALRGIAAAACFDRLTAPVAGKAPLDLPAFRLHSLAVACAAQALARQTAPEQADEIFMAGLLHDIGIIVQWRLRPQWLPGARAELLALAESPAPAAPAASSTERERRALGATHAHCGRVLLSAWHLPARLVHTVATHDLPGGDPGLSSFSGLPGLLALADHLAGAAGYGFDLDPPAAAPDESAAARHGLTPDDLAAAQAALPDLVQRLCAVFED